MLHVPVQYIRVSVRVPVCTHVYLVGRVVLPVPATHVCVYCMPVGICMYTYHCVLRMCITLALRVYAFCRCCD